MTLDPDQSVSVAQMIFTISLLPQIYYNYKNKVCRFSNITIMITIVGLALCLNAYVILELDKSVDLTIATMLCWVTISFQKVWYEYKSKRRSCTKYPGPL